jgi:hypothetical protein
MANEQLLDNKRERGVQLILTLLSPCVYAVTCKW